MDEALCRLAFQEQGVYEKAQGETEWPREARKTDTPVAKKDGKSKGSSRKASKRSRKRSKSKGKKSKSKKSRKESKRYRKRSKSKGKRSRRRSKRGGTSARSINKYYQLEKHRAVG